MIVDLVVYRRAYFTARLPKGLLYTRAHFWISTPASGQPLRIGLTPLATRMLGEIAFVEYAVRAGEPVELAETIGSLEGVKAISELYSPATGLFRGGNPDVEE